MVGFGESDALRLLTFSSLYPSAAQPRHGIFVETRLAHLVQHCDVDARVIAPVPWFPLRGRAFGRYAEFAAAPKREHRKGIEVRHPRYLMLPKVGVPMQPDTMAFAARAGIRAWQESGWWPELLDAHYFYPDGVAAALLAERFGLPLVITARGSDVNLLAKTPYIRKRIVWSADRAQAIIAVSPQLKRALVDLGISADKVVVLRNGVDLEIFKPHDRRAARDTLGLAHRTTIACVGNLKAEKGFTLAIDCVRHLADTQLLIVGEGAERMNLEAAARRAGVADRVIFRPSLPQERLQHVYSSADVLLLTSTREGWPNVLLEALACGTPIAAVDVGAVGEIVTGPAFGRIAKDRDPAALARVAHDLIQSPPSRERLREHAALFDWRSISVAQHALFLRCIQAGRGSSASLSEANIGVTRPGSQAAR